VKRHSHEENLIEESKEIEKQDLKIRDRITKEECRSDKGLVGGLSNSTTEKPLWIEASREGDD